MEPRFVMDEKIESELLINKIISKTICQLNVSSKLVGRFNISKNIFTDKDIEINIERLEASQFGIDCVRLQKVAIVVPYRNRSEHLQIFLNNIHQLLIRQNLVYYHIFVIEQQGLDPFNRGRLMNIGFIEALKWYHGFDCFIFHDVDLIPEDDRNDYRCSVRGPRHMSGFIDKFNYKKYTDLSIGGVCSFTRQQFDLVNGFSNKFWGWGGEDHDLANRVRYYGMNILRMENEFQRYTMLKHEQDKPNPFRRRILKMGKQSYHYNGLNSLRYRIIEHIDVGRLYTKIIVNLGHSIHNQVQKF